jgi:hypothetical protein
MRLLLSLLGAVLLAPSTALAEPTALVHAQVGGLFPGLFNELSTSYSLEVGGGWVVPALDRRLAVVLDVSYTAPGLEATRTDSRVGGSYSYQLVQHDLSTFLGGHWHFADLAAARLVPYGGLGLRLHLRRSTVEGTAGGQPLGTNEETSTGIGAAVRGGLGLRLGPGLGTIQVEGDLAPLDHRITGDRNQSSISTLVGYALVL